MSVTKAAVMPVIIAYASHTELWCNHDLPTSILHMALPLNNWLNKFLNAVFQIMTSRPRSDLFINLPALRKLDHMLLVSYSELQHEFNGGWGGEGGGSVI